MQRGQIAVIATENETEEGETTAGLARREKKQLVGPRGPVEATAVTGGGRPDGHHGAAVEAVAVVEVEDDGGAAAEEGDPLENAAAGAGKVESGPPHLEQQG
eukprot:GHVU01224177.1.p2 GENE.GHVU01224177.1~~GHVU01224177.1.p2  ORF type:complete len:102 (+),score=25.64 GHVU01224177.1:694-999(+)